MATTYQEFDGDSATEAEVIEHAKRLKGKRLRDVILSRGRVSESKPGDKGAVGQLVERAFGLARSSEQRPDFGHAGIELKVVPLKRSSRSVRSKERTSVTMIDYAALVDETWPTAKVRKKIEKIFFVFYFHVDKGNPLDAVVEECVLWRPTADLLPQLESDWHAVQRKVLDGLAHQISEGDGRVLGAATKGAGGGKLVDQPRNPAIRAKPRAWALKPALTSWLYEKERSGNKPIVSLRDALKLKVAENFEDVVLRRLKAYEGRTLAEVARTLKVPISKAKSGAAVLVRRAIGVLDDKASIEEFKERGIQIKVVPISPSGRPYEAMSFPKFDHMTVWKDEWEESDLLQQLDRMLIVPLVRAERATPKETQVWGRAFFWSPSADQLNGIECEWRDYCRRIQAGEANKLPGASQTKYIHVRPHARDSQDTEQAPRVGQVVKKCFWLNQNFIAEQIAEYAG